MSDRDIFINAPEPASTEELGAYLDKACGDDEGLRARVEALFKAENHAGAFLNQPPAAYEPGEEDLNGPQQEGPGFVIGRYKLLQEIGAGGFGVVYMAEQLRPVKRRVALKIIKLGMDTKQVVARFEAERQALALMDHPNIAKVFDAGATESGRPYFVMELVKGVPLTNYCDENSLTTKQRLKLFVDVCAAIQHAHQKGIIHRDIKPSNVMITMHDDKAVAKVIDFGVAKATQQDLTDKTLFTQFEQFIGTPVYMSPEQAQLSGLDVDTRSDIYSLGVLLYELLTGTTPFDSKELVHAGCDEIRRRIREEEPPKPSTRLSTLEDAQRQTIAKHHQSEPNKLSSLIRGDLDWIVMKAMEKDRTRRYGTAAGLAADIERHLADEPVTAVKPTTFYQLQKYGRKHRKPLIVAGVIASILVMASVVSSWLAIQATQAQRRESLANKATTDALKKANHAGSEAQRNAQIAQFQLAEQDLSSGKTAVGIARLAALARKDPNDSTAAERFLSALFQREFPHQLVKPVSHGKYGLTQAALTEVKGNKIVTASYDKTARIWDATTGRQLGNPLHHDHPVEHAAFSPDGSRILTTSSVFGDESLARVWDAETGEPLHSLPHDHWILLARFSPDGKFILTGSDDRLAKVWDVATGKLVGKPLRHAYPIDAGDFRPGGREVVTATDHGQVQIWDIDTGAPLGEPYVHGTSVWSVRFSNDGEHLVTGTHDGRAQVWEVATGKPLGHTMLHQARVSHIDFSPDGNLIATASWDGSARIWHADSGLPFTDPLTHVDKVSAVQFNASGDRLVTASMDNTSQVWDVGTGRPVGEPFRHGEAVSSAEFNNDGTRVLTASDDDTARLWSVRPGQPQCLILRHQVGFAWAVEGGHVWSARFSPDGKWIVTASNYGTAQVWDAHTGRKVGEPLKHAQRVAWAAFNPDNIRILTATFGRGAYVWNGLTGEKLVTLSPDADVRRAEFSPDGRWIATPVGTNDAQVWDVETGEPIGERLLHQGIVRTLRFSPDNQWIVTCSYDETARLWEAATGKLKREITVHGSVVFDADFSPDGRWLATFGGSDSAAWIWDVATGEPIAGPMKHGERILSGRFSPDGGFIVTGSFDGTAQVWEASTGKPRGLPLQHAAGVFCVRFSPDSKRVVTASRDQTARIWDASSGLPLSEPLRHDDWVLYAEFSPDGNSVVTSGGDGTARIWQAPPTPVPVPDWVIDWAEAVVETKITPQGAATLMAWEDVVRAREQARSQAADGFYGKIVRWFYDDPSTRTVSPFTGVTVPDYVAAQIASNSVPRINPDYVAAHIALNSVPSLKEAVRVDPNNPLALGQLAIALRSGSNDSTQMLQRAAYYKRLALPRLHQLAEQQPGNLTVWSTLAKLSGNRDDIKKAAAAAVSLSKQERLSDPSEETLRAIRTLSRMAVKQGQWNEAQDLLESLAGKNAKGIFAQTTDLMQLLGALYAQSSERMKHEQYCGKVINHFKNAKNPYLLERATKMYLTLPPLPDSPLLPVAVKMARQATELMDPAHPNFTYMAVNRAMAEYRLGEYEEAQRWLEKRDFILAIPFRAMVAHQLGHHQEAQEALELAKELLGQRGDHDHLFARLSLKEARELIEGR